MAFSFGNTPTPSFFGTTTTPKPVGFGTSFPITPNPVSTGTGFGSTFGQPSTFNLPQQSVNFSSGFGSTTSTAQPPAFGSTFGTQTAGVATPFTGFGSAPSTFGATSTPSFFSSTQTTKPSLFSTTPATGLFSSTTTPSLFGSTVGTATTTPSLFGTTPSTGAFSFGNTATSAPSAFGSTGFGTVPTTSAPTLFSGSTGLFGSMNLATAPSLFGSTGFGVSSQPTQTSSTGFGLGTGFSGFTPSTGSTNIQPSTGFGTKPTAQEQPPSKNQIVLASIYSVNLFNDERDDIIKKWNLLQACWGVGKGYYSTNVPPVEYDQYNPFYRFKAVGYNIIPKFDNIDGIVKLIFNKKYDEVCNSRTILFNGITALLGNRPNLKITIDSIKAISDVQTELRFSVFEKGVTGPGKNVPASDLASYLNQPTQKQQLSIAGVCQILPYVTPSRAVIDDYMKVVPQGFESQMWEAASVDNPDRNKFIPVPIYGFPDLQSRKIMQDHETGRHKAYEIEIDKDIAELKNQRTTSVAKINDLRQRYEFLKHRLLKILIKQETVRKAGLAIQPQEEVLKGKLESLYLNLKSSTHFKGRLNELISTVKIMEQTKGPKKPVYKILPESQGEFKEYLQLQQNGIAALVNIVHDDLKCLKIIIKGTEEMLQLNVL